MASSEFTVSLSAADAAKALNDGITCGSITGELIDSHTIRSQGGSCFVLVFEKHYIRAGNRLTLTVAVDDLSGRTRVHAVGGGGGEGLFRFDWGASESFADAPRRILAKYII